MAKSAIAIARAKARRRNRDYVKHSAVSDITAEQELAMRRKARKCPMCGTSLTSKPGLPNSKHLDHIIPICVGGTHTHGNVRIVCASCNLTRPKDGRDYAGPVTLWAQGEVVTGRASTTCRKGLHPWAPENIEVAANGKRRCKPCRQASDRLRRKGRKHPPRPRKICQCGARFAAPGHTLMCPDCVLKATREALALRFADELSWGEIATRVGYGTAEGIRYRVMQTGALPPRQPVAPRQSKPERTPCQCGARAWHNGRCRECVAAAATRAVELRVQGWTLRMIADELGYSSQTSIINLINTTVDAEQRTGRPSKLDRGRLDAIIRECWPSHTVTIR